MKYNLNLATRYNLDLATMFNNEIYPLNLSIKFSHYV